MNDDQPTGEYGPAIESVFVKTAITKEIRMNANNDQPAKTVEPLWMVELETANSRTIGFGDTKENAIKTFLETFKKQMAYHGGDPLLAVELREDTRMMVVGAGLGGSLGVTDTMWFENVSLDRPEFDELFEHYAESCKGESSSRKQNKPSA
jgi:hypothetical protein